MSRPTCIAPLETGGLCGEPATEERLVGELICPLCEGHAHEVDQDRASEMN